VDVFPHDGVTAGKSLGLQPLESLPGGQLIVFQPGFNLVFVGIQFAGAARPLGLGELLVEPLLDRLLASLSRRLICRTLSFWSW
jgi:hypothetical protein